MDDHTNLLNTGVEKCPHGSFGSNILDVLPFKFVRTREVKREEIIEKSI